MWHKLKIEKLLEAKLKEEFGEARGEEIYGDYTTARRRLVEDVLTEIKAIEPNITSHGPDHVEDVLRRAYKLLGEDKDKLSFVDLYCLCLSVLFHDVGNLHGRTEHNKKIADIYAYVRNGDQKYRNEQFIITKICEAHCGESIDGSSDTLKDVPPSFHLLDNPVRPQVLAAILRFADELAEGPQRTSAYMQAIHKYGPENKIYHEYSSITNISIDRGNGRIVIIYSPEIKADGDRIAADALPAMKEMLEFIYKRIIKLDQERKYAKHYCEYLSPFKETQVQINFYFKGRMLNIGLSPITLSDLVLPGHHAREIPERNKEYVIDQLLVKIATAINEGETI